MLELVAPTLAVLGLFWFLGWGVGAAVAVAGRPLPRGWATLVGVGLGVGLPVLTLAHRLRVPLAPTLAVLVAVAAGVLVVSTAVLVRRAGAGQQSARTGRRRVLPGPDRTDAAAAIIAALVLLPMLQFGATMWTRGANDGPNYVASAQIWLAGDGAGADFAAQHPDFFGDFQVARAAFEKPMVTALYAASDVVSGQPVYRLLTPVLLVALLVLSASMLRLVTDVVGLRWGWALAVTVPPIMSVVFVSRVQQAQVGQTVAVALLAQTLLLLAALPRESQAGRRPGQVALVVVAASTATAALGASATVVLAASPAVLALAYVVVRRAGARPREGRRVIVAVASVAAGFSVPFLPWYLESLALQAGGLPGLSIAEDSPFADLYLQGVALGLPTPLAVVGLEPPHDPSAALSSVALLAWGLLLVGLILAIRGRVRAGRAPMGALLGFLAVGVLNAALVAAASGVGGYGMYKWLGVLIPLSGPILLGLVVSWALAAAPHRTWALAGVAGSVVVVSCLFSIIGGRQIDDRGYVASPELIALGADSELAALDHVNIDTGNWLDDATAAVIVPARRVTVTRRTYPPGGAAAGGTFLVGSGAAVDRTPAAPAQFEIVRRDPPAAPVDLDFGSSMAVDWVVLGDGYRPSGAPLVATGRYSTITLADVDPVRGGCLRVQGRRASEAADPLQVTVTVAGSTSPSQVLTTSAMVNLQHPIPQGPGGESLTVEIETDDPYSRGSLGYPETAQTGLGLHRVTVDPRACPTVELG